MSATVRSRGGQSGKNTNSRLTLLLHRLRAQSSTRTKVRWLLPIGRCCRAVRKANDGAQEVSGDYRFTSFAIAGVT